MKKLETEEPKYPELARWHKHPNSYYSIDGGGYNEHDKWVSYANLYGQKDGYHTLQELRDAIVKAYTHLGIQMPTGYKSNYENLLSKLEVQDPPYPDLIYWPKHPEVFYRENGSGYDEKDKWVSYTDLYGQKGFYSLDELRDAIPKAYAHLGVETPSGSRRKYTQLIKDLKKASIPFEGLGRWPKTPDTYYTTGGGTNDEDPWVSFKDLYRKR